jgi:hypothetical protein
MRQHGWVVAVICGCLVTLLASASAALAQQRTVTVALGPQNASGITGTAVLTDVGGGQTRVDVRITPAEGDHPAHIHMGTCANLNPAPEFPLSNVQNGSSSTMVNASLSTIESAQRAINLHLSAEEAGTYVACGDIQPGTTQAPNANPPAAPPGRPATNVGGVSTVVPAQLPRAGEWPSTNPGALGAGLLLIGTGIGLKIRARRGQGRPGLQRAVRGLRR